MALKTVHVTPLVNNLDHTNNNNVTTCNHYYYNRNNNQVVHDHHLDDHDDGDTMVFDSPANNEFMVMGHRGAGMNMVQSDDPKMKLIKENTVLAFNAAGEFGIDFVEFDVQIDDDCLAVAAAIAVCKRLIVITFKVANSGIKIEVCHILKPFLRWSQKVTKDDCPVIFHDNFILTQEKGVIIEKRVTDLSLDEFLSYGPQREPNKVGKPLFRKTKDGRIFEWKAEKEDHFCTLEEVFQKINHSKGFNIEFKFDDDVEYTEDELVHAIQVVLQVTKDDCPVIFHDNFILTQEKGVIIEKRVTDLSLDEFLSYGPQREPNKVGKPLFRKTKDGRIFEWKAEKEDHFCTLEEVFQKINHSKGFNIEFKFDDDVEYTEDELVHAIQVVLQVVFKYAKDRPIFFSSFQPDATLLVRKLQNTYPVLFLTNGGCETYTDVRRNSLEEAMKLCLSGGLNGIVAEVRSILRNPGVIKQFKESKLSLVSYGQLNNMQEVVKAQILMGVDGVIVDLIQEITEVVADFRKTYKKENVVEEEADDEVGKPLFRKTKDGRIFEWKAEKEDHFCTLEEVFQKINHSKGFNIEFKFDDDVEYTEDELVHAIQVVLQVVFKYAKDRPIFFSSFQPDATLLVRKLQNTYPVLFLTNGGCETYTDVRRNSLEEAMKLCLSGGLNGIVAEVRSILRNPGVIKQFKESKLSLVTYGQLNNMQEVVKAQILMGVDGVIVDLIQEITEVVADFRKTYKKENVVEEEADDEVNCSENQLSNLTKLIPGLGKL
ncbi:Glycerophosphoryl diester phosphodiesterase [Artemisia annua]|uniref:glycerophosphodiester phosphodiesterase n=1 Tax=Artemisia annua TaxID=35608 RepID=A0A2U1PMJ9_ARTAN|nr:Glycerophosphoryl diester phosphodiesterase [Artemisia annua]